MTGQPQTIIEAAFELAQSTTCHNLTEIRKALKARGFRTAMLRIICAGLGLSMAPAFAQSGTGAEGSPGGAGTGGAFGTGAPLTNQGGPAAMSGTAQFEDDDLRNPDDRCRH